MILSPCRFVFNSRVFLPQHTNTIQSIGRSAASYISRFGRASLYPQQPQAAASRAYTLSKKEPKGSRTNEESGDEEGGTWWCRYAKDATGDRQFLFSRRHWHRLKIQFEKSNNTAQFARKCVSRSSSDGIVRRVDTMRPIGGAAPHGFLQRTPSATFFHYRGSTAPLPLPPIHHPRPFVLFVSLQLFFPRTTVWLHACQV